MLDQKTIEEVINDACVELYQKAKCLIDDRTHERTIVADHLGPYLRGKFSGWDVNTEFNREGKKRGPKKDLAGKVLVPDIIVHKHGPDGPNLAVIQVKGYWNREPRAIDEAKLRRIQTKHGYKLLYRLELGREKHQLLQIV